jgi:hypothetical protein
MSVEAYMDFTKSVFSFTQMSVGAYMNFVNSMFSFSRGSTNSSAKSTERVTKEAKSSNGEAEASLRETIKGSVRTSEMSGREEPHNGTAAPKENGNADAQEDLAIEDYDSLNVKQATQGLEGIEDSEVKQIRHYEEANKNRSTLLRRMDERLGTSIN